MIKSFTDVLSELQGIAKKDDACVEDVQRATEFLIKNIGEVSRMAQCDEDGGAPTASSSSAQINLTPSGSVAGGADDPMAQHAPVTVCTQVTHHHRSKRSADHSGSHESSSASMSRTGASGSSKGGESSSTNECPYCNVALMRMERDAIMVCAECGIEFNAHVMSITTNVSEARDTMTRRHVSLYKRMNHFNETLTQIQGLEKTAIPPFIIAEIKTQCKKYRITQISPKIIRKQLKRMGLSKYYENTHQIANIIEGKQRVNIDQNIIVKLRSMFQAIQTPFDRVRPNNRKNFLNYSFVIHKMLQLMRHDDLLVHFPLLKSRVKLQQQDYIWKHVCESLGWEFVPSV